MQVHPEAEPPQARSLVGHSQGQLDGAAFDLLSTHQRTRLKFYLCAKHVCIFFIYVCVKQSHHEVSGSKAELVYQQQREVDHVMAVV